MLENPTLRRRGALILFTAIVCLNCVWVLSMPVFPSQDGPLHLYYVNIFRQLLTHHSGPYAGTFYISHYLPPYSLYYYGLMAFGSFTSLEMADKLMVCLAFFVLAFGGRLLVRQVSRGSDLVPFLLLPLLINWPLMMGFINYSLATGLACFALAIWCGAGNFSRLGRAVGFLLLLGAVVLTHPVPWMFVVVFVWFELAVRFLLFRFRSEAEPTTESPRTFDSDAVIAAIGSAAVLYLMVFSRQTHQGAVIAPAGHAFQGSLGRALGYLHARGLVVFAHSRVNHAFLGLLFVVAAGFCLVTVVQARRTAASVRSDASLVWALLALCMMVVLPFIPPNLNDSVYFAARLLSLGYLSAVVGAALPLSRSRWAIPAALVAACLSVFNVGLAFKLISPYARRIATLQQAPATPKGQPGILVDFPERPPAPHELSFEPYYWAGAHYAVWHDSLLYNSAWLNLAIIPIKPTAKGLAAVDPRYWPSPPSTGANEFTTAAEESQILSRVGFVLGVGQPASPENLLAAAPGSLTVGPAASGWTCDVKPAYQLCLPPAKPAALK